MPNAAAHSGHGVSCDAVHTSSTPNNTAASRIGHHPTTGRAKTPKHIRVRSSLPS